jgi:PAS domain-containing protein
MKEGRDTVGASVAVGGDVAGRSGRADLPVDVRRRVGGEASDAAVVEAVLDALPSPTVLLDPDGTVVMGNRAWTAAGEEHGRRIDIAADYYADALLLCDDADARTLVQSLRELAEGLRSEVSIDRSLPSPAGAGLLWFHVQARRVDEAGHVVVTHTDVTSRVRAEQAAHWPTGSSPSPVARTPWGGWAATSSSSCAATATATARKPSPGASGAPSATRSTSASGRRG